MKLLTILFDLFSLADISVAFAVNAVPLGQTRLGTASLSAAYQVAAGANGWFQGKASSKSMQLLYISGSNLSHPARSFPSGMSELIIQQGNAWSFKAPLYEIDAITLILDCANDFRVPRKPGPPRPLKIWVCSRGLVKS